MFRRVGLGCGRGWGRRSSGVWGSHGPPNVRYLKIHYKSAYCRVCDYYTGRQGRIQDCWAPIQLPDPGTTCTDTFPPLFPLGSTNFFPWHHPHPRLVALEGAWASWGGPEPLGGQGLLNSGGPRYLGEHDGARHIERAWAGPVRGLAGPLTVSTPGLPTVDGRRGAHPQSGRLRPSSNPFDAPQCTPMLYVIILDIVHQTSALF